MAGWATTLARLGAAAVGLLGAMGCGTAASGDGSDVGFSGLDVGSGKLPGKDAKADSVLADTATAGQDATADPDLGSDGAVAADSEDALTADGADPDVGASQDAATKDGATKDSGANDTGGDAKDGTGGDGGCKSLADCNDGDGCTNDSCSAGKCVHTDATCTDAIACTDDTCVSPGGCVYTPNTAACDDGDACTTGDACSGGSCKAGKTAVVCDDGNPCTTDACAPASGCTATPVSDGAWCNGGSCVAGSCAASLCAHDPCVTGVLLDPGCSVCAGNVCAADGFCCTNSWDSLCVAKVPSACGYVCPCIPKCSGKLCGDDGCGGTCNGAPKNCDDGDPCTTDSCGSGGCGHVAKVCSDGVACTADGCDGATGTCVYVALADGATCADSKACTTNEHCLGGACLADFSACTCSSATTCNDGQKCTVDACVGGKCSNSPMGCDDANPCTLDACDPATGTCSHTADPSGVPLSPACNFDACNLGVASCVGGKTICAIQGPDPGKEGQFCPGDGVCKSGACFVDAPPSVVAATFGGAPVLPGLPVALTVVVADADSDATTAASDVVSAVLDASAVGGDPAQALASLGFGADPHTQVFGGEVATAGLQEGVYLLPLTVTDKHGSVRHSVAPLYVYTGTLLHVGAGQPYADIKSAILDAVDGDAVAVHEGTYLGVENKNITLAGKKILVMGLGTAEKTIIDCEGTQRAFSLNNVSHTPQSVIANFTVQNCALAGVRVYQDLANVVIAATFVNLRILGNSNTDNGGGIHITGAGSTPGFALTVISGNSAGSQKGGGVYCASCSVALTACSLSANLASDGLGIFASGGKVTLIDSDVSGHSGATANAITTTGSALAMTRGTVGGNSVKSVLAFTPGATGGLQLSGTRFVDNTSKDSAVSVGKYASDSVALIDGVHVVGNKGLGWKFAGYGKLTLQDSQFLGNATDTSAAWVLELLPNSAASTLVVSGTSLGHNSAPALHVVGPSASKHGTASGCTIEANTGASTANAVSAKYVDFSGGSVSGNSGFGTTFLASGGDVVGATVSGNQAISAALTLDTGSVKTCTFAGNAIGAASQGDTATLIATAAVAITDSTFSGNSSPNCAGVWLSGNGGSVSGSFFADNKAGGGGGALCIGTMPGSVPGTFANAGSGCKVSDCTFSGNAAKNGGAIHVRQWLYSGWTAAGIKNCLLEGNIATGLGGGLYLDSGSSSASAATTHGVDLRSVTIVNNAASEGGGIYAKMTWTTLDYAIVWNNLATNGAKIPAHQVYVNPVTATIPLLLNVKFSTIRNKNGDIGDDAAVINKQTFFEGDGFGNLEQDPQFVVGPKGAHYLAQVAAGQAANSPCVDPTAAGVITAVAGALEQRTTRTDGAGDAGNLDLGFHYAP